MNAQTILQLLGLILPPLINAAETFFAAKGSGPQKKTVVSNTAQTLLSGFGVTPDQAPADLVGAAIEDHLTKMKALGPVGIDIETGEPLAPAPPDPQLTNENAKLKDEVTTLSAAVTEHQQTIGQLTKQVNTPPPPDPQLTSDNAKLKDQVNDLNLALSEHTETIGQLRNQLNIPAAVSKPSRGMVFEGGSLPARME